MTPSRSSGWRRIFVGNRIVWVLAATALASLLAGTAFGAVIVGLENARSQDEVPDPGLITVPIERRVITNEIVARGDAVYADAVEINVDVASIDGPAVVTGRVPAVGSTLDAGSIALEVAGRPLIVLPGELPVYRELRVGVTGPDVAQLKAALTGLGIDPGDETSALFDAATSAAVAALYSRIGYEKPESEEGSSERISAAESSVRSADLGVLGAARALDIGRSGLSAGDRAAQDAQVRSAERALDAATATGTAAERADAEDALAVSKARRDDALAPTDTSVEAAALTAARAEAAAARRVLAEAQQDALTVLPASEVAFVPSLPRRVDATTAVRGRPLEGPALTASGATLVVVVSLPASEAAFVDVGAVVEITLPEGTIVAGAVATIDAAAASGDEVVMTVTPTVSDEESTTLQGQNVRVSIPVESTGGEVLAVPVAALSAGADGSSRIEIPTGEGRETKLVEVVAGLAAGGFVEVTPTKESLEPGDEVVVGR